MANSSPVVIASNQTSIPVAATLSAETTKVIGTVNQGTSPWVTSNATTSVIGNGAAATAQRVTLANDSTGVIATVGAVTAITNALPTGTNSIGKISDITTSIVPGVAATNLGKAEDAAHVSGDTGVMALGVRQDADTSPVNADGDYHALIFNNIGRLKTSNLPAATAVTTGNLTASTQTVVVDTSHQNGVTMQLTGTFGSFNGTFEGSIDGGTTYNAISAARSNSNTVELTTGVLSANPGYFWKIGAANYTNVRIRCTAIVSGTAVITFMPAALVSDPTPASQSVSLPANQSVNVAQVAGTATSVNNGTTDAGTTRVTLSSDSTGQVKLATGANTIGALTANQSTNVAQLAGTTTDTNSGNKSAGTLRTVIATDQPNLTTPLNVALAANQSVNVAQINGVTPLMGNGTTGTGSQRVTIASDNTANSNPWLVTQSPATSGGLLIGTGSIGNTATSLKGTAGQVYGWYFYNPNATVAYVQFFNTVSGSVTVGTTPPVYSLGIPATSGANVSLTSGIAHSTAIVIAITTTRAGGTSPGSTVDYNVFYK